MAANLYDLAELGQTLFEEAGDALFLFDPDTEQLLDANPTALRLTGFHHDDLLSRPVTYWFRTEDQGGLNRLRQAYKRTGIFHSQEGFLLRHREDGVWIPVNLTITRLHAEPKTLGLITARDITERRQAQLQLQKAEERLRTVISNSPVVLFALDKEGIITLSEGRGLDALGLQPNEAVGRSIFELYKDAPQILSGIRRALAGENFTAVVDVESGPGAGMSFETHYAPLRDRQDRVTGVIGIANNITDRRRAEQALLESEERYRELFENANDIVYTHDLTGIFTSLNKAGERITGYTHDEMVGKNISILLPPDQLELARRNIGRKVGGKLERTTYELEMLSKDGRRIPIEVSTRLILKDGKPVAVQGIARDTTERRRLEEQLRRAQKIDAIGQLAGGIAHDFNNLLTAMLGNISLISSTLPEGTQQHELAKEAEKAAIRAAELTNHLLSFSRRKVLRLEATNLKSTMVEVVGILRRTIHPGITLEVKSDAELWPVLADSSQMNQVLMNLCLNARDAMPNGGRLTLAADNVNLEEQYARLRPDSRAGEFVRLRVTDTGHGMAPDVRSRIFEPFFTTKEQGKGTGLGLAMVFGILKQHHGWIDCYSEPDRGTRFDIYLPRYQADRHGASQPVGVAAPRPPKGGTETILLVDDEAMLRNLGRTILQRFGYQVLVAEDGVHALEVYRKEQDRIQLVILDQMMPRLTGKETLVELLQINPDVRVLISSGLPADQASLPTAGPVLGFIPKPYSPSELANAVRTALDQSQSA